MEQFGEGINGDVDKLNANVEAHNELVNQIYENKEAINAKIGDSDMKLKFH